VDVAVDATVDEAGGEAEVDPVNLIVRLAELQLVS
jgi:hypothetical protein